MGRTKMATYLDGTSRLQDKPGYCKCGHTIEDHANGKCANKACGCMIYRAACTWENKGK